MLSLWNMFLASSFFWAVPMGIMGLVFWFIQYRADRTVKRLGDEQADMTAEQAAKIFLTAAGLGSVPAKPSLDHRRNVCDPETGVLFIAPSFWESRTVEGAALAFRAAGLTNVFHRSPERICRIRRLDVTEQVLFWTVFVVMGFGLMAESLPVTLAAYGLFGVTLGCFFARLYLEGRIDAETFRLIEDRQLIGAAYLPAVAAIFRADRYSFCHRFCAVERPFDPEIHAAIPAAAFSAKTLAKTGGNASRTRRENCPDPLPEVDRYTRPVVRNYRKR